MKRRVCGLVDAGNTCCPPRLAYVPPVRRVERVTVRALIEALRTCPLDAAIAISSDPEGNQVTYFGQASIELGGAVVVLWPSGHGAEVSGL